VGNIDEVVNQFADEFKLIDHAVGLEFTEKHRLHEFLAKIVELFPDVQRTDQTLLSDGDRIISEWTLTGTENEPLLYGRFLRLKISAKGVSVVRVRDGRIVECSEYYDQVISRRYRLAGWFTDWTEV
jgi:ketosteroid isomerase-like protein